MNYWPRWIGSIQKKTSHLSLTEMGAYDRLLDHCYATEAPLPADEDRCCRIAGASTKPERAAVAAVLREFFALTDAGYVNERVASELLIAKPKIEAARTNGAKGGRPRKIPPETRGVSSGNPARTQSESSTSSSTEVIPTPDGVGTARKRATSPPRPHDVDAQVWTDWLALRKAKRAPVTETVVESANREAQAAGLTLEAFLRVWCARGSQGLQADWLKPHERGSSGAGKHTGFGSKDYRNGVEADGTFTA